MRMTGLIPILALLVVASCTRSFYVGEAGNLDPGDFGNATMQNTLTAKGQLAPPISDDKYDASLNARKFNGKFMASVAKTYTGGSSTASAGAFTTTAAGAGASQ